MPSPLFRVLLMRRLRLPLPVAPRTYTSPHVRLPVCSHLQPFLSSGQWRGCAKKPGHRLPRRMMWRGVLLPCWSALTRHSAFSASRCRALRPRHKLGSGARTSAITATTHRPGLQSVEGLTRPMLEDMARSTCELHPAFPLHLARCCCRKLGHLPLVQSPHCQRGTASPSRAPYSGCCSFDACACSCRSRHVTAARASLALWHKRLRRTR